MAQTRAVMPSRYVPLADELLETTGINDYSTLIGILLSRYGQHLLATWQIQVCPHPMPAPIPANEPTTLALTTPEPFTQMEF
jgi:hypothetical protein